MFRFKTKEVFFILLLFTLILLNIADFATDYRESEHSTWHLLAEALIIVLSFAGVGFLLHEIHRRVRETETLRGQLSTTRHRLTQVSNCLKQASRQYGEVIQEQFNAWDLTPSEKDVALLLLKGLSFEEIANVRDTREKTVRQQATAIYRKSGLNGRHEFAAWFFEDFLQ